MPVLRPGLTQEEARDELARMTEATRQAFRIFLDDADQGRAVLQHMATIWYGDRPPFTPLDTGGSDFGRVMFNVGKQAAYMDVCKWVELAKQSPRDRQEVAVRSISEG